VNNHPFESKPAAGDERDIVRESYVRETMLPPFGSDVASISSSFPQRFNLLEDVAHDQIEQ
jgi:hypothetical protein